MMSVKQKKLLSLIAILVVVLVVGLGTVLVVTRLSTTKETVAPTAPESKPQAAEWYGGGNCDATFTVNGPGTCADLLYYVNDGTSWVATDAASLNDLLANGDVVRLVARSTSPTTGAITKARFQVNDAAWVESTNANDDGWFYFDYTIPDYGTFDITAEVFDSTSSSTTAGEWRASSDCEEIFTLVAPEPASCSESCGDDTDCGEGTSCVEGMCRNPECSGEEDCTCPVSCNNGCNEDDDCADGNECIGGMCRNPGCTAEEDCTCPVSCNNGCTEDSDCSGSNECVGGKCRNPECSDETDCTCAVPASCNDSCTVNADCEDGNICSGGMCRNPNCTAETDCTCTIASSPTTTITKAPTATPTAAMAALPDAGISLPTLGAIGGGIVMVLLGILLAL